MSRPTLPRLVVVLAAASTAAALVAGAGGCVTVNTSPVIADRRTVLEEQASGSFPRLEDELVQAGLSPRPLPFTRGELEAAGVKAARGEELAEAEAVSDGERADELLAARCIGEARDGTLVETRDRCTRPADETKTAALLARANRNRRQVWRYLQEKRPQASLDEVRKAWREAHLRVVICGAPVEREDGTWELKSC